MSESPFGTHHRHPGGARGDQSPARRPGRAGDVRPVRRLLRRQHTDVLPDGEFVIGDIDVLLGDIDGCPFYIDKRLDEAWHQDQFLLDVADGEPEDFSLAAGDNLHFVTQSSLLQYLRGRQAADPSRLKPPSPLHL